MRFLLLLFVLSPALAGTLSINGKNYTYSQLTVKSNGDVSVTTTKPPPPPPPNSNCPTVSNVRVISVPWKNYASQKYALGKSNIIAFKFTVGSVRSGNVNAAYTSTNPTTHSVVISKCPGDMAHPISKYCKAQAYEAASVAYDSGTGNWAAAYECQLKTGQTYYADVKNAQLTDLGSTTCPSNNCPIWFGLR